MLSPIRDEMCWAYNGENVILCLDVRQSGFVLEKHTIFNFRAHRYVFDYLNK